MKQNLLSPEQMLPTPTPEIVVIGGTTTADWHYPYYAPLLNGVPWSTLPPRKRFLSLPHGGNGRMSETYEELSEKFDAVASELEVPPIVVGHSQGGSYALRLGLEGKASGVLSMAGVNLGMNDKSIQAMVLRSLFRNPPAAIDLAKDSEYMIAQRKAVANDWLPNVPLDVVGPTWDEVVSHDAQFGLQMPPEQQHNLREWHDVPAHSLLRRALGRKGINHLRSDLPSEHVSVVRSPGIQWLLKRMQQEIQADSVQIDDTDDERTLMSVV